MVTGRPDRESIVTKAVEIGSAEDRDAYIAQVCDGDPELQRQVEEEVQEHLRGAGRSPGQGRTGHTESRENPLTRIGPYKVLKHIGEDAAGTVYRAEQQEPVRRPVALRLIKEGMDWDSVFARFAAERDALLRLEHPNIARVLDGGSRESGQPYVVAEWVEGSPITAFCDKQQLPVRRRLELFQTVCRAVQYAHQKGVIHGDLRPSNVLVAGPDDRPTPRVLDFGVARAVGREPIRLASADEHGDLRGLAEYLSPEQADANVQDLDTRSDVYSLGVILYELLTGTTPLTADRLENVSPEKGLRLVREEVAPAPSARIDELKDRAAEAAEHRQSHPKALAKALHGDLDCVALKALKKDPEHRYQTAGELARDIDHYLNQEPIEACPLPPKARLWKAARRHSGLAAAVAALSLLLLAGAVAGGTLAWYAFHKEGEAEKKEKEAGEKQKKAEQAEADTKGRLRQEEAARKAITRERDAAQDAERAAEGRVADTKAVLAFLNDKLLAAGRPAGPTLSGDFWAAGKGKDVTLGHALQATEPQVAETFADRPLAEAKVREILGSTYLNIGEPARAVKQYERALALREAMQGVNDPETSECRNRLAFAYRLAERPGEAGRLYDQNPDSPGRADALGTQGAVLLAEKKPAEAELKLRQALAIRQKREPDNWRTFDGESLLGEALLEQKKYAEAEPFLLSGYKGLKKHEDDIPDEGKVRIAKAMERLVRLYESWGKRDKAAHWQNELAKGKPPKTP